MWIIQGFMTFKLKYIENRQKKEHVKEIEYKNKKWKPCIEG